MTTFPVYFFSLLLAMSGRIYLLFPLCGHNSPPTLHDRSNAVTFQSPAMPNARTSLCTQIHALFFLSYPLRTTPSRFPNMICFGNRPSLIRISAPAHIRLLVHNVVSTLTPSYLEGTVVRGLPMVWSLELCPNDTTHEPVVYGAEFEVVLLAKSPRTSFIQ